MATAEPELPQLRYFTASFPPDMKGVALKQRGCRMGGRSWRSCTTSPPVCRPT